MVTWHRKMKLNTVKCYERTTLRKLWRQTGNTALSATKFWPLLHVIRACSWRWHDIVAGISARFSKFAFVINLSKWSVWSFCFAITNQSLIVKCCLRVLYQFEDLFCLLCWFKGEFTACRHLLKLPVLSVLGRGTLLLHSWLWSVHLPKICHLSRGGSQ